MKNLILTVLFCVACFNGYTQTCPTSIRVGSSCNCHSCTGTISVVDYETYVKRVLPQEWLNCWGSQTNGENSLRAGSVAIRSYTIPRMAATVSSHGGNYDICTTTCCHAYGTSQFTNSNTAVDATYPNVLLSGSTIQLSEYSAENNDNNNPNSSCGNCNSGGNGWPCIPDPVCCGQTFNGHGRGMCQNGSARWATGLSVTSSTCNWGSAHGNGTKTWQQILALYYPSWTVGPCGGGCTTAPSNDACSSSNAVALQVGTSCNYTSGDICGATESYAASGCASALIQDVWFKFTASNGQYTITLDPSSGMDGVVEARQGSCSGTVLGCADAGGGNGAIETLNINASSGTIYVRVYDYTSAGTPPTTTDFEICVVGGSPPTDPDLEITTASITNSSTTFCPGEEIFVDYTVVNNEPSATITITTQVGFYLIPVSNGCPTSIPSGSPFYDGSLTSGEMSDNDENESASPNLPDPISPDDYYLVLIADWERDLSETDEGNNIYNCVPVTILPSSHPDCGGGILNISISGDNEICQGESTTLTADCTPTPCTGYIWSNGATTQSLTVSTAGTYSVTGDDGTTTGSASKTVDVNPSPTPPQINGSLEFCTGSNTTLAVLNPCNECTYDWSGGTNTGTSSTVSSAGIYSVTATNSCGSVSASVNVTETSNQPIPTINGDLCFHPGQSTELNIGNLCSECTYQWSENSTSTSLIVSAPGIYSVTVTGNCGTASGQASVIVLEICPGITYLNEVINFTVFPNPNTGTFTVQLTTRTEEEIQVSVVNMLGQEIFKTAGEKVVGEYSKPIELKNAAAGVYFVRVKVGEGFANQKIIVR